MDLTELAGWAAILGGIPTALYYLIQRGKQLRRSRLELSNAVSDRSARRQQWTEEILWLLNFSLLSGIGYLLCRWLAKFVATA